MKKFYYPLLAILMAATSFSLVSCSDDDDDKDASYDIVGTWKMTSSALEDLFDEALDDPDASRYYASLNVYIQIKSDGTYTEVDIDEDGVEVTNGKWSLSGDNLTVTGGGFTVVYGVISCSSTTLTLSTFGFEYVCTKVPDSEIEQYLNGDYDDDDDDDDWDDWD